MIDISDESHKDVIGADEQQQNATTLGTSSNTNTNTNTNATAPTAASTNWSLIENTQSVREGGIKRKYEADNNDHNASHQEEESQQSARDGRGRGKSPFTAGASAIVALQEKQMQPRGGVHALTASHSSPREGETLQSVESDTQAVLPKNTLQDETIASSAINTNLGLQHEEVQVAQETAHWDTQDTLQPKSPEIHNMEVQDSGLTSTLRSPSSSAFYQPDPIPSQEQEDDEDSAEIFADNGPFSDYGSDSSSFYDTLLSSATDYYWENGHRYHAHGNGRYMLPNDETELDREDMKHHEWMLVTDFRLHLSPILPHPQRILDIGTGTGIWAMQIAEIYPSASVIGTDISPVQSKWVPPNLTFEVDDLEQEWLYRPGTYDLINIRFMFLAIKDFPAALRQAYQTLKPGGYIELSELELSPTTTPPLSSSPSTPQPMQIWLWLSFFETAVSKSGYDMHISRRFKTMLEEAGFVDIVETRFEVPWGEWNEDRRLQMIGLWHMLQLKQGLHGMTMAFFTRALGWTPEYTQLFLVDVRREFEQLAYQIMDHAIVVYGRKPLDAVAT